MSKTEIFAFATLLLDGVALWAFWAMSAAGRTAVWWVLGVAACLDFLRQGLWVAAYHMAMPDDLLDVLMIVFTPVSIVISGCLALYAGRMATAVRRAAVLERQVEALATRIGQGLAADAVLSLYESREGIEAP